MLALGGARTPVLPLPGPIGGTLPAGMLGREFGPNEPAARSLAAAVAPWKLLGRRTGETRDGRKDQVDPSRRT